MNVIAVTTLVTGDQQLAAVADLGFLLRILNGGWAPKGGQRGQKAPSLGLNAKSGMGFFGRQRDPSPIS